MKSHLEFAISSGQSSSWSSKESNTATGGMDTTGIAVEIDDPTRRRTRGWWIVIPSAQVVIYGIRVMKGAGLEWRGQGHGYHLRFWARIQALRQSRARRTRTNLIEIRD